MKAFGLKKCSTTQDALKYLKSKGLTPEFTCHYETAPTREQVKRWMDGVGGWEKLINRSGYTWRGLAEADKENLTDAKVIKLVMAHPALIRRPLLEHDDGSVSVGFSPKVKALL